MISAHREMTYNEIILKSRQEKEERLKLLRENRFLHLKNQQ